MINLHYLAIVFLDMTEIVVIPRKLMVVVFLSIQKNVTFKILDIPVAEILWFILGFTDIRLILRSVYYHPSDSCCSELID